MGKYCAKLHLGPSVWKPIRPPGIGPVGCLVCRVVMLFFGCWLCCAGLPSPFTSLTPSNGGGPNSFFGSGGGPFGGDSFLRRISGRWLFFFGFFFFFFFFLFFFLFFFYFFFFSGRREDHFVRRRRVGEPGDMRKSDATEIQSRISLGSAADVIRGTQNPPKKSPSQ